MPLYILIHVRHDVEVQKQVVHVAGRTLCSSAVPAWYTNACMRDSGGGWAGTTAPGTYRQAARSGVGEHQSWAVDHAAVPKAACTAGGTRVDVARIQSVVEEKQWVVICCRC